MGDGKVIQVEGVIKVLAPFQRLFSSWPTWHVRLIGLHLLVDLWLVVLCLKSTFKSISWTSILTKGCLL